MRKRRYWPREKLRGKIVYGTTQCGTIDFVSRLVAASDGVSAEMHGMGTRIIPMSLPRLKFLEKQA